MNRKRVVKKKKRGVVKECEVLLKLHNRFWWRCSLSLESISLPTSLACPHRPGGRNSYQQHLLFRQSPHFSGGGGNVACYKKKGGGGHVQNSLCFELGHGRWWVVKGWELGGESIFLLWDTWPGNAWPGPVCVIYTNNQFPSGSWWVR